MSDVVIRHTARLTSSVIVRKPICFPEYQLCGWAAIAAQLDCGSATNTRCISAGCLCFCKQLFMIPLAIVVALLSFPELSHCCQVTSTSHLLRIEPCLYLASRIYVTSAIFLHQPSLTAFRRSESQASYSRQWVAPLHTGCLPLCQLGTALYLPRLIVEGGHVVSHLFVPYL